MTDTPPSPPSELGLSPARERAFAAILGALVADAAALGFHWLYDVARIAECGGSYPEFRAPTPSDFEGFAGYFAHAGKPSGALSQYGEGLLLAARTLLAHDGRYMLRAHQAAFRAFFGPGGDWVGYVDHPTQATLQNLSEGERRTQEAGLAADLPIAGETKHALVQRILPHVRLHTGEALLNVVKVTHPEEDPQREAALAAAAVMDAAWPNASGDQDDQLPALSALVPLVVVGLDDAQLEDAVRVTHHDERAVAWALACAGGLRAALGGASAGESVAAVRAAASGAIAARIGEGLALEGSAIEALGVLGRNCRLHAAVPGLLKIANEAPDFATAIRDNIRAGGDSCGRALVLGALLGATHGIGGLTGIPYAWLTRLGELSERVACAQALASFAQE